MKQKIKESEGRKSILLGLKSELEAIDEITQLMSNIIEDTPQQNNKGMDLASLMQLFMTLKGQQQNEDLGKVGELMKLQPPREINIQDLGQTAGIKNIKDLKRLI